MMESSDINSNSIADIDDSFNEADWFSLEQSIKDENIIPIIGPDALQVEYQDQEGNPHIGPFYRLVAADLLKAFRLEPADEILEDTWTLHKAVNAVLTQKGKAGIEQQIRRQVSRLIAHHSEQVKPAESLVQLAGIKVFNLFVSLTPDNLLERAMALGDNSAALRVNAFSPRDASESLAELNLLQPGERGVFQLFGTVSNTAGGFAIHEEDTLEYLYLLQSAASRRFATLLSELRRRDKLLIGCNFPDWLGRAMLRLINDNRFYAKETSEFLLPQVNDANLRTFLNQFSPNTLGFYGKPERFIDQLAQTFNVPVESPAIAPRQSQKQAPQAGPSIFVSYASQNAVAARRIADTLLTVGFSDVWLDKKKLIGGDDWSDRIDEAIQKCDFFMPLLSKQADSRREGVFWDEWKTAIKRARRIQDVFLLPTGIDPEPASNMNYFRIGDGDSAVFFDKHLFHAPDGVFSADDQAALAERCRRFIEANYG